MSFWTFIFTILASRLTYFFVLGGIAILLYRTISYGTALLFLFSGLGTAISVTLIKLTLKLPRPEVEALVEVTGYGFPSGHAAGSMFLALASFLYLPDITFFDSRALFLIALLALAFMIGTSRIYFGVHSTEQVLAGFILGALWAIAPYFLLKFS